MGAPAGHPFFGNQYTNGGYVKGTFTFSNDLIEKTTETIVKELSSQTGRNASTAIIVPKPESLFAKIAGFIVEKKNVVFGVTIAVVVIVGAYSIVKYVKCKKSRKDSNLQTVELENIGVCQRCGKPLNDSFFYPGDAERETIAFIQCRHCGEKNLGHYVKE